MSSDYVKNSTAQRISFTSQELLDFTMLVYFCTLDKCVLMKTK